MTTDDMELIREYVARQSAEAFATIVAQHIDLVHSVALRRLRDPAMAEDATQAVFIILARKARSLGPRTILSAWLCRTAQYVATEALRAQTRRQNREQQAYMQSLLNQPDDSSPAWDEISPLLDLAMAELAEKDHRAIVLRYFDGKDFREVATAMGVNESAAKMRVSRAVEKLRTFFAARGVAVSASTVVGLVEANAVKGAPATLAKSITAVALAREGAAGVSLKLAHGASKVMAWAKLKFAATIAVAILVTGAAATLAVEHQHEHRFDSVMNRLGNDFMKDPAAVGLSVGILNQGREFYYNFGTTERGKVSPPTRDTIYEIGSITKTFLTYTLATAVVDKKVNLEDDIRRYLGPGFPNLEYEGKGITLAQLANGTSGLPNFLPSLLNENGSNTREEWYAAAKKFEGMSREDFFAALHTVKLTTVPGSRYKHSNAAAHLLRYILEDVYKAPIHQLFNVHICGPLAMTNTSFSALNDPARFLARGFDEQGNPAPYTTTLYDEGSSGLDSSAADLVRFIRLQLDETNPVVQLSHQKTFHAGDADLALTWNIQQDASGNRQLSCDGTTFGFSSYLSICPERHAGIILLANECDASTTYKLSQIAQEFFKELIGQAR